MPRLLVRTQRMSAGEGGAAGKTLRERAEAQVQTVLAAKREPTLSEAEERELLAIERRFSREG